MSLHFSHKPNYFLFAQLLMRHIESYIHKHQDAGNAVFNLEDIYELFHADFASASINLEGIMNIADEYKLETLTGDQKLIHSYQVDARNNTIMIHFNPEALNSLKEGKSLIEPDATIQE